MINKQLSFNFVSWFEFSKWGIESINFAASINVMKSYIIINKNQTLLKNNFDILK